MNACIFCYMNQLPPPTSSSFSASASHHQSHYATLHIAKIQTQKKLLAHFREQIAEQITFLVYLSFPILSWNVVQDVPREIEKEYTTSQLFYTFHLSRSCTHSTHSPYFWLLCFYKSNNNNNIEFSWEHVCIYGWVNEWSMEVKSWVWRWEMCTFLGWLS